MNTPKFLLLLSICFLAITSCTKTKYPELVSNIDSLQTVLNKTEDTFEKIDFEQQEKLEKIVKENCEYIEKNNKDTIRADFAFIYAGYYKIGYGQEPEGEKEEMGEENEELIEKEIDYTQKQLKKLKRDLKNNFLDSAKAYEYYNTERDAANKVYFFVNNLDRQFKYNKYAFDSLHPKVVAFIDKLKDKK